MSVGTSFFVCPSSQISQTTALFKRVLFSIYQSTKLFKIVLFSIYHTTHLFKRVLSSIYQTTHLFKRVLFSIFQTTTLFKRVFFSVSWATTLFKRVLFSILSKTTLFKIVLSLPKTVLLKRVLPTPALRTQYTFTWRYGQMDVRMTSSKVIRTRRHMRRFLRRSLVLKTKPSTGQTPGTTDKIERRKKWNDRYNSALCRYQRWQLELDLCLKYGCR